MRVGIAQLNHTVGDLEGNAATIYSAYEKLVADGAELVVTPELSLTGYPPRDLVFKSRFVPDTLAALAGCQMCINAHAKSLTDLGATPQQVHESVRIAAAIQGFSVSAGMAAHLG